MADEDKKDEGTVEVRVLFDSDLGKCNTVVSMPAAAAKKAAKDGLVDASPEAVAACKDWK